MANDPECVGVNVVCLVYRLRTLVKTAKKKLREQDGGELGSPLASLRGDLGQRQSDAESAISRMKAKVQTHSRFQPVHLQFVHSAILAVTHRA